MPGSAGHLRTASTGQSRSLVMDWPRPRSPTRVLN
ncbi:hypothetical protein XccvBFoX7_gp08 [Xanthomonas phage FoX7]|uniref:Uncharacterized protein n=2 Tax=Carpasinavirus XcP1 TaxID=2182344 RepID=A0A858NQW0_9CAUD|nr:hypothetical protein XccvBFoX6_gp08 [Xanthomonas phage FoX6]QJB22165.1 hypothetical protein XccvBFoX7_gp08 [Xanthomonas phage FoX7]